MRIRIRYLLLASSFCCSAALALELDADLYGELNVSYDWNDSENNGWQNYVSRLGIKGKIGLSENLSVIYQVEQKVDIVHGGTQINDLLSTRNTFIGISGSFGKLMFGAHDSPFKKSQGKVDLFNNQAGDISALFSGEIRAKDSLFYHSAGMKGWQVQAMYIPSDSNFGSSQSVALTYDAGDWFVGLSIDADMRKNDKSVAKTFVYDSYRAALQYTPGPWKFGWLMQRSEEQIADADAATGFVASISYTTGNVTLMAQHGNSDIVNEDISSDNLGIHYHFNKKTKVYLYYWSLDDEDNIDVLSMGLEHKF